MSCNITTLLLCPKSLMYLRLAGASSVSVPPGSAVPFRLMSEAFPDPTRSFSPKDSPERPLRSSGVVRQLSDQVASAASGASSAPSSSHTSGDAAATLDDDDSGDGEPVNSDAIPPSMAKARAEDMGRLFSAGTAWYFVDSSEKTQGPYSGAQMDAWFRAGCGFS